MRNQCLDKAILRPEDKGNCATYVNTLVEQISFLSEYIDDDKLLYMAHVALEACKRRLAAAGCLPAASQSVGNIPIVN